MMLRSKNDSMARYEPNSTTIASGGGRIRNQTMTASAAMSRPTLSAAHASPNARLRVTDGGSGTEAWWRWMRGSSRSPACSAASRSRLAADRRRRARHRACAGCVSRSSPSRSSVSRRAPVAVQPGAPRMAATSASSSGRRAASSSSVGNDRGPLGRHLGDPGLQGRDGLRWRRDLVEAGEPERVVPRLADRAGARVFRSGGSPLAGEPVARVETPEAAVAMTQPSSSLMMIGVQSKSAPGPTDRPSPRA